MYGRSRNQPSTFRKQLQCINRPTANPMWLSIWYFIHKFSAHMSRLLPSISSPRPLSCLPSCVHNRTNRIMAEQKTLLDFVDFNYLQPSLMKYSLVIRVSVSYMLTWHWSDGWFVFLLNGVIVIGSWIMNIGLSPLNYVGLEEQELPGDHF